MIKFLRRVFRFLFSVREEQTIRKIRLLGFRINLKRYDKILKQEYDDIITTVNYFSQEFKFDDNLINRIIYNSEHRLNKKTYEKDKAELQNHFDLIIDAKKLKQAKGPLRYHQIRLLETAKEIVLPLEQENIRCSMNGGFLIGALRHNGFIPWDDDADFDLIRGDYDRFCDYVKKKYIYADSSECKTYMDFRYMINEFMEKNPEKIIFTELRGYLQAYRGKTVANQITLDFIPWECIKPEVSIQKYDRWRKKFAKILNNYKLTWGEIAKIYRNELNTNKMFTTDERNCNIYRNFGGYGILYPKRKDFLNINCFYPCIKLKFEDTEFLAANNYEKYLALDFKDYTKVPISIDYAKFIKNINLTSKNIFGKEYYIKYEDLLKGGKNE